MGGQSLSIQFYPVLPASVLIAAFLVMIALWLWAFKTRMRHAFLRLLLGCLFIAVLSNPSFLQEERTPAKDIVTIIVDESASQDIGEREEQTQTALHNIQEKLKALPHIEVQTITSSENDQNKTKLFETLENALSDIPQTRRAGSILITDGRAHDMPKAFQENHDFGPTHIFLTGNKKEHDRHIEILEAPAYGIVGSDITLRYKVVDTHGQKPPKSTFSQKDLETVKVTFRNNNGTAITQTVPVNTEMTYTVPITQNGQNILEIEAEKKLDEISYINNKNALLINGVRERLKVLLVSGKPYSGGRTWRNLLTGDPAVDLVHFTILRGPSKVDSTPQNELSLIAFPFKELFEQKLYDFDLIIFDHFFLNRIIPNTYFANIVRYVREGGGLLIANGEAYAGNLSLYNTPLKSIIPASPAYESIEESYKPTLTNLGHSHPVTMDLEQSFGEKRPWGSWLRQIAVQPGKGDIVLKGVKDLPLLILNRVNEGRIAQLASDHIWLWSRGYEGGGPHLMLLRKLAHWLMKEPELDENALKIIADDSGFIVHRRSLQGTEIAITVEKPDGSTETFNAKRQDKGRWMEGHFATNQTGVYRFSDNTQTRFAIWGDIHAPEYQGLSATEDIVKPLMDHSGGSLRWIAEDKIPTIRMSPPRGRYAGPNWIGLRQNNDYISTGITHQPLWPEWLAALFLILFGISLWWKEGETSS